MLRLIEHYRLPELNLRFGYDQDSKGEQGFFKLKGDTICFGTCSAGPVMSSVSGPLHDVNSGWYREGAVLHLPFNPDQLVDNLLLERYSRAGKSRSVQAAARAAYYALRSHLPVGIRRSLQRAYLSRWRGIPFPEWPVDCTVERLLEKSLALVMDAVGVEVMPFIWFWPNGHESCAIVTHDVEEAAGASFCSALMDLDDSFGIKSAFQIIPEGRYPVTKDFLSGIRSRGFEINVHDLNHDGNLFASQREFLRRVVAINRYGKQFEAAGFRAGVMYRNQEWFSALDFEYDMTVPNTAHLEPQRGGCCTIMPYFIGKLLELPLTTTQDHALFHYLRDYSLNLWQQQADLIRRQHGLISILAHPDNLVEKKGLEVYRQLLRYLVQLRNEHNVWLALPGEVNTWWRRRNNLHLVPHGERWRIEGQGSEHARIAYAVLQDGEIKYRFNANDSTPPPSSCQHLEKQPGR